MSEQLIFDCFYLFFIVGLSTDRTKIKGWEFWSVLNSSKNERKISALKLYSGRIKKFEISWPLAKDHVFL